MYIYMHSLNCLPCIIAEALYSVKGGDHTCCVLPSHIETLSPTLNGSSELQCYKRRDTIGIGAGIMFIFYLGLPHM